MAGGQIELKLSGNKLSPKQEKYLVSISVSEAIDRLDEMEAKFWVGRSDAPLDFGMKHGAPFVATIRTDKGERKVSGDIVEIGYEYSESGGLFVTLRGISTLHRLKRARRSMVHKQKKPEDVAKFLAGEAKLSAKAEGTSAAAMDIIQANQTDARFLKNLADMVNYSLRVDEETLIFGRTNSASGKVVFDLMKDNCRLNVTHSLDGIVDEVTVIGHDHTKSSPKIEGKAKATDVKKISGGKTGVELAKKFGSAKLVIESANIAEKSTAEAWAKGELQRRAERFVRGSIRGQLSPEAVSGGKIEIKNAPKPLAGTFLITEVTHTSESGALESEIKFCSDSLPA